MASSVSRRQVLKLGLVGVLPACAGRAPGEPPVNQVFELSRITSNEEFYVVNYSDVPVVNPSSWRLAIDGLVSQTLSLRVEDVTGLALRDKEHTLQCIGASPRNLAIGNAIWTGLPLDEVLTAFGVVVDEQARFIHVRSADAYLNQLFRSDLDERRIWVVTRMNGEPLPAEHGFPARLLVAGRYGFKNPKWIERLTFSADEVVGTWQELGYPDDGSNRPAAFVHHPEPAEVLGDAPLVLVGSANCGNIGITSVELSRDDGASWFPAELVVDGAPDVWTTWRFPFTPAGAGDYVFLVKVRADDGRESLPENPEDNGGWQGYGRIAFRIR